MRDALRHPVVQGTALILIALFVVVFSLTLVERTVRAEALADGPTSLTLAVTGEQSGQTRSYTLSWEHDGINTDGYVVTVDGAVWALTPTCGGVPRVCSGPLTMLQNVTHAVIVKAFNSFGESASDPFVAAPPATPGVVKIR